MATYHATCGLNRWLTIGILALFDALIVDLEILIFRGLPRQNWGQEWSSCTASEQARERGGNLGAWLACHPPGSIRSIV